MKEFWTLASIYFCIRSKPYSNFSKSECGTSGTSCSPFSATASLEQKTVDICIHGEEGCTNLDNIFWFHWLPMADKLLRTNQR